MKKKFSFSQLIVSLFPLCLWLKEKFSSSFPFSSALTPYKREGVPPFPWARGEYGGRKGWRATASSRETEGVKGIKRTDEINKGKSSLVKRASLPIISFPMMCLWYSIGPSSSPAWLWGKRPPRIEPREPRTNALALSLLYHGFAPA